MRLRLRMYHGHWTRLLVLLLVSLAIAKDTQSMVSEEDVSPPSRSVHDQPALKPAAAKVPTPTKKEIKKQIPDLNALVPSGVPKIVHSLVPEKEFTPVSEFPPKTALPQVALRGKRKGKMVVVHHHGGGIHYRVHHGTYYHGGHYGRRRGCFPSKAKVETERHGPISIDKLSVGDKVMTRHGYSEVLFFAVRKPKTAAKFLQITTSSKSLVLTSSHAVFKGDGTPTVASKVHVGDELLTAGKVLSIETKNGVGLVAPITASGALVVDGVATSDYGPLAHRYGQGLAHAAMSPLRALSWMFPNWSIWHKHNDDGHHPFKIWGKWLLQL